MGSVATSASGIERFRRALAGEGPQPPVTGVTFVDPAVLSGGDATVGPVESLVGVCGRERLDFAFVVSRSVWSARAVSALGEAAVAGVWVVDGVLSPALSEHGVVAGLRAAARGAEALAEALDRALDAALAQARRGIEAGASAIVVADDMAGSAGPLLDPAFLREAVFSRLTRVTELARAQGTPAILHCDGDARLLMRDAAAAGFVAIHGDAGGAAGLERGFEAALSAGLAFIGGLPTAELSGTAGPAPARWRERALAHEGGLLLADDGGVTTGDELRALFAIMAGLRGVR